MAGTIAAAAAFKVRCSMFEVDKTVKSEIEYRERLRKAFGWFA
jgi:hypothetical protein